MILGRPTNLWLGAAATVWGLVVAVAHVEPTVAGLGGAAIGSIITLIAGQPPTVNPGDRVNVTTPAGQETAHYNAPTPQ